MGPAELLRRALALDEQLKADHATLSVSHNNLGLVLRQLGDLPGARGELARAIELGERTLGAYHPANFAVLLYRHGTLEETSTISHPLKPGSPVQSR